MQYVPVCACGRYGGIKDRDGLWRLARDNLIVFPERMPLFVDTTNTHMYAIGHFFVPPFFSPPQSLSIPLSLSLSLSLCVCVCVGY